jgi:hypothetical protein
VAGVAPGVDHVAATPHTQRASTRTPATQRVEKST